VNLLDTDGLVKVMNEAPCEAVIHFAAYIAVGESMKIPEVYFLNNVAGSLVSADGNGASWDRQAGLLVHSRRVWHARTRSHC
jgi:dTDP-4-dehydrorhamnose reductase